MKEKSYIFNDILKSKLLNFDSHRQQTKKLISFNRNINSKMKNNISFEVRESLTKFIKPKNSLPNSNFLKLKKYQMFFDALDNKQNYKRIEFKKISIDSIKSMHRIQTILQIPTKYLKRYFNCISCIYSKKIITKTVSLKNEINKNFLKEKVKKLDLGDLKNAEDEMYIKNINKNISLEYARKFSIIQKEIKDRMEDFNIDLFLMTNFFDKKIKKSHLKIKGKNNKKIESLDSHIEELEESIVINQSDSKKIKIFKDFSKPNATKTSLSLKPYNSVDNKVYLTISNPFPIKKISKKSIKIIHLTQDL